MKFIVAGVLALAVGPLFAANPNTIPAEKYGPTAAIEFARRYQGEPFAPGEQHCYPDARGIPFTDTENIISMTASLWTPQQLTRDFKERMAKLPEKERKKGILVVLKTERCATKWGRFCSITTAAIEKRSSPLVSEFLIYGVWLKSRDDDNPPGSLKIETGADSWKNEAAGEYQFEQGPGATLVFIDPDNGSKLDRTDAAELSLYMQPFLASGGSTPQLHAKLEEIIGKLKSQ